MWYPRGTHFPPTMLMLPRDPSQNRLFRSFWLSETHVRRQGLCAGRSAVGMNAFRTSRAWPCHQALGLAHRCPFWLIGLKKRGRWFTWWFNQLPGPSIFPKRTPMVSQLPRSHGLAARLASGCPFWPHLARSARGDLRVVAAIRAAQRRFPSLFLPALSAKAEAWRFQTAS